MIQRKPVRSFRDLEVYQSSYQACIIVAKEILPKLPEKERFDLKDQLSRSTKAVPRLIAEGYAKKHQKAGFQKYIDDATAETNETIVGLEQRRDIYDINPELCDKLIDIYDKIARQLFKLAQAWDLFRERNRRTKPFTVTSGDNGNVHR
jgi:four helix bundle protein